MRCRRKCVLVEMKLLEAQERKPAPLFLEAPFSCLWVVTYGIFLIYSLIPINSTSKINTDPGGIGPDALFP